MDKNLIFEIIFKKIHSYLSSPNLFDIDNDIIKTQCDSFFVETLKKTMDPNIVGFISKKSQCLILVKSLDYIRNNDNNIIVVFNACDGISNFKNNSNLGSIYGLYKYDVSTKTINIVNSGYCCYGIHTYYVYTENNNTILSVLDIDKKFRKLKNILLNTSYDKNIYSLNQSYDYNTEISFLINQYRKKNYNMRYTGTLVGDAHRILCNGGIFFYLDKKQNENNKTMFLYDALPLSLIFKYAKGIGTTGYYNDLLESKNINLEEKISTKTSLILASSKQYNIMNELLRIYNIDNN